MTRPGPCVVGAALALLSLGAHPEDIPPGLFEKELVDGNILVQGVRWPDDQHAIGFKTVLIGDPFDPGDPKVHAYTRPSDSQATHLEPFTCAATGSLPAAQCTMILWNDSRHYPQALQDLGSAFGDGVRFGFTVLFSRAMSPPEVASEHLPVGRIVDITLTDNQPSRDFVAKATAYFTEKYGSPVARTTYKNPEGLYSKECMDRLRVIDDKPVSGLTPDDQAVQKRCDGMANLAFLAGKGSSGRTSQYAWSVYDGQYDVTLSSEETRTGDPASGYRTVSRSAVILIRLNMKDALKAYAAAIDKTRADWQAEASNKDRKDF